MCNESQHSKMSGCDWSHAAIIEVNFLKLTHNNQIFRTDFAIIITSVTFQCKWWRAKFLLPMISCDELYDTIFSILVSSIDTLARPALWAFLLSIYSIYLGKSLNSSHVGLKTMMRGWELLDDILLAMLLCTHTQTLSYQSEKMFWGVGLLMLNTAWMNTHITPNTISLSYLFLL